MHSYRGRGDVFEQRHLLNNIGSLTGAPLTNEIMRRSHVHFDSIGGRGPSGSSKSNAGREKGLCNNCCAWLSLSRPPDSKTSRETGGGTGGSGSAREGLTPTRTFQNDIPSADAPDKKEALKSLKSAVESAEALEAPDHTVVAALEVALEAAERASVDMLELNHWRRRLNKVEETVHKVAVTKAKKKLGEALTAIERIASANTKETSNALALLQHVYAKHPPKKPSLSQKAIRNINDEPDANKKRDRIRKALLKAQRDYHPDHNTGMVRQTLDQTSEEWEVLSLTICQQLALTYDRNFKGKRGTESAKNEDIYF